MGRQGSAINKSLLTLGNVIRALSEGKVMATLCLTLGSTHLSQYRMAGALKTNCVCDVTEHAHLLHQGNRRLLS